MIKNGPAFTTHDRQRLREIADAARARAAIDSNELEPTSQAAPEDVGALPTMPLEGPDPEYVRSLEDRIRKVFAGDPEVIAKMGPQKTAVIEAAGHLVTTPEVDRQRPMLHTVFQPAKRPSSGTVAPTRQHTMRTPHAGTSHLRNRLAVPGHERPESNLIRSIMRSIRHGGGNARK